MTSLGDRLTTRRKKPANLYDVIGRLQLAMHGTVLIDVEAGLDYWIGGCGNELVLEWSGGPSADEARQHLITLLVDRGRGGVLRPEDLALDPSVLQHQEHRLRLLVRGVTVQFRHIDPTGLRVTEDRAINRIRQRMAANAS